MLKEIDKKIMSSKAGYVLEKEFKATNEISKSIAGSALKCYGDNSIPSSEIKEKAEMMLKAGKKVYHSIELELADGILKKCIS